MIKKVIKSLLMLVWLSSNALADINYKIINNIADVDIKMSVYPVGGLIGSKTNVIGIPARVQFIGSGIINVTVMGSKSVVKGFSFDGDETRDDLEHLFIEGGLSYLISNNYYNSNIPVYIGEREGALGDVELYTTIPTVNRDIYAVRTGMYYSDCSYVTQTEDSQDIHKNDHMYIVYSGIGMTTVTQVEIALTDRQNIDEFGRSKSYFSMETTYIDLLYALEIGTSGNSFGIRLGTNRTINSFMDYQFEIGLKPGEGLYCLTGIGAYVAF